MTWRAGDMLSLPFEREFDAVYSFFTSFGYFGDDENEQVLAGIARALKPGGRFLLDILEGSPLVAEHHATAQIVLYQRNLERFAHSHEELIEQIGVTVLPSASTSRERSKSPGRSG